MHTAYARHVPLLVSTSTSSSRLLQGAVSPFCWPRRWRLQSRCQAKSARGRSIVRTWYTIRQGSHHAFLRGHRFFTQSYYDCYRMWQCDEIEVYGLAFAPSRQAARFAALAWKRASNLLQDSAAGGRRWRTADAILVVPSNVSTLLLGTPTSIVSFGSAAAQVSD